MAGCLALLAIDGAVHATPIIPSSPHIARYLQKLGTPLSYDAFLQTLLVFTACYGGLLAYRRPVSTRFAAISIGALSFIVFLGPILLSQDIFSYLAYARMGVLHGVNPYVHGPGAITNDAIYRYVGSHWKHSASAYGPLFTLLSYPFGALGLYGGIWGLKAVGAISLLLLALFTGLTAKRLGRDPARAALLVALNPLTMIYTLGGFHNDLLMAALMMAGIWLAVRGQEAYGAAAVIAGAMVKATAAVVVPFMVLGTRRLAPVIGAIAALAATALLGYVVFGPHALDFASVLKRQQSFVSTDSFPNEVAHLFGKAGIYPVDRTLLRVFLIFALIYVSWRVWRGYDWIAASGWVLLAIAVSTTWLLAWYTIWALPPALVSRDRRLLIATLFVQGLFLVHQLSPLFSPV
jgi:hypothetical protein